MEGSLRERAVWGAEGLIGQAATPARYSPEIANGHKPSFTREQFVKVRSMLGQQAVDIARIAKETGLTQQTVYRIKDDPCGG